VFGTVYFKCLCIAHACLVPLFVSVCDCMCLLQHLCMPLFTHLQAVSMQPRQHVSTCGPMVKGTPMPCAISFHVQVDMPQAYCNCICGFLSTVIQTISYCQPSAGTTPAHTLLCTRLACHPPLTLCLLSHSISL